ncbi:uncharacterized protein LOC144511850 [Mustelus asterias]
MRKSGPGETISKLLRRKSSPSLYAVTPPPGQAIPAAAELQQLDKLDDILAATRSNKGAMNMVMDSGTAKVKQRPTVKLAIPFQGRPTFAVPTPTLPDRALYSKIPRTVIAGNDVNVNNNRPNVGDHGQSINMPEDDWIPPPPAMAPPPPPPMAPPPPPTQNTFQNPHTTYLPYEVAVPPPPKMAPPLPPPLSMASQHKPASIYQPPDTNFSPPPNMIPPPPPFMAPLKSLPKAEQYPKTSAPSTPKVPPPPPPFLLPPNDYSFHSPWQDGVSKSNEIKHLKKSPPPPPQRDIMQHSHFPPKPERDVSSSFKFFPSTSQISVPNNQSLYKAESPEVIPQPLFASTFNPKAPAKLFGFPEPLNKSESSLDSDWQNKGKSMIVMKDADQYPMDQTGGITHTTSMPKKAVSNEGTECAAMSKVIEDSAPYKPQKPARKNNLLMQQSKPVQNKGVYPIHSGSSLDHSFPDGKEKLWSNNMDLRHTSSRQIHDPTNHQNFSSNLPVTANSGIEYGKSVAGEKTKPTLTRDFENQSSSENVMLDFQSPKPVEQPDTPDSPAEQNTNPRSPLALLMAAKRRDSSKGQGFHKAGSEASSLSLGGTRYIKSTNSNTIHITRVADNKECSSISQTEEDTTAHHKHIDDILSSLKSAEKSHEWSKPSLHSTARGMAEPEDTQKDVDMSLLLIPPPPSFSDEENEEPSFGLLPPPFEFSNHNDNQDDSSQPERRANNESGLNNLHPTNSDKRGLSLQGSTHQSADHLTPNHYNSLSNTNSYSINKSPLTMLSAPVETSFAQKKPPIVEKPRFLDNGVVNGGSAKFHNSKQVSDSHTYSQLMSKTYGKNVPKMEPQQTETVPSTNKLVARNKVIDELQSKVQGLSTKSSDVAFKSSQNAQSYGRTFTIRPGTKQPITVVYPSNTK